jgi:hypothetical protein
MPKELLDRPDIVAVLKQMSGKGMSEGVTTGRLGDPGFPDGLFDSPLQDGFVEMMPLLPAGHKKGARHASEGEPGPVPFPSPWALSPGTRCSS